MPDRFPPIAPVKTRSAYANEPLDRHILGGGLATDDSTAFAYVLGAIGNVAVTNRVSGIAGRIYRERTTSMLDDLAEVWWRAEHAGARVRPFASLPIADRAELRVRVKKLLAERIPDALGDQAVLEAETTRLLELPSSALRRAGADLERLTERDRSWAGTGATAEAAIFAAGHASVAHIGDGRTVRLRRGKLETLTTEHTIEADQLGPQRPRQRIVLRALGMPGEGGRPDTATHPLEKGDVFLLLNGALGAVYQDDELAAFLRRDGVSATARLVATGQTRTQARIGAVAVEIL